MGGLVSYFKSLFGSKEMRILILGLDGAGKTTILYRYFLMISHLLEKQITDANVPQKVGA